MPALPRTSALLKVAILAHASRCTLDPSDAFQDNAARGGSTPPECDKTCNGIESAQNTSQTEPCRAEGKKGER